MEQAKDEGKAIGRPRKSDENIKKAISMYQSGTYTLHDIKQETGISKSTLYRYLENADLK
ncbi:recombinase family protein, partial [Butyricicoccus sp. 1XD8-22]